MGCCTQCVGANADQLTCGQKLRFSMGLCLSSCVECFTYIHDRYIDWRWNEDDLYDITDVVVHKPKVPVGSIHTAVIDKKVNEIRRITREDVASRGAENAAGETALHLACKLGYVPIVKELLSLNYPANSCTTLGTPIHCVLEAVKKKYITNPKVAVRLIHVLVQHGCDVNASSRGKKAALHVCAENGDMRCMKTLLSHGASVNVVESNCFTPLYITAVKGQLDCVNLLLSKKPDIDIDHKDMAGRTPLIAALITVLNDLRYERLHVEVYDMAEVSEDQLILHRFHRMAIVEALIRAGADPNALDNYGRSALKIGFTILEVDNVRVTMSSVGDNFYTQAQNGFTDLISPDLSNHLGAIDKFQDRMAIPESVYAPLVRLLVLAGGFLGSDEGKDYSDSPEWLQQLHQESQRVWNDGVPQKPLNLILQCRLAIRGHLGSINRLNLVHTLPLPPKLMEYVCVRYI